MSEPVAAIVLAWNAVAESAEHTRLEPTARPSVGIEALLEQHERRDDLSWWRAVFESVARDGWWSGRNRRKASATTLFQVARQSVEFLEKRLLQSAQGAGLDGPALRAELQRQMARGPTRRRFEGVLADIVKRMGGAHAIGNMNRGPDLERAFSRALAQVADGIREGDGLSPGTAGRMVHAP